MRSIGRFWKLMRGEVGLRSCRNQQGIIKERCMGGYGYELGELVNASNLHKADSYWSDLTADPTPFNQV